MRKLLLLPVLIMSVNLWAQNVGIGTTNPLSRLHIADGASGNFFPFSPLVVEGNSNTYINLLSPNANETAILFGTASNAANGGIVYNNASNTNGLQFRTNGNNTRMVITNTGNAGIGLISPSARLSVSSTAGELNGTAMSNLLRTNAGSLGGTAGNEISLASIGFIAGGNNTSLGIRAYRNSNASDWSTTSILFGYDVDNTIRAAGGGAGFIAINANGNIGIGTASPNAPLGFPPFLGKKITLYPGNTGDAGFGMSGNRLQIYSDNPSADIALGYDAAGVFNERFAFKPNGAIAVNGNAGGAGQLLQSNGGGAAATWTNKPYVVYYNGGGLSLLGSSLCADIPGVNGQTFNLGQNSYVTYQFTIDLFGDNGAFGGGSNGAVNIQILNNSFTVVSNATSQFSVGNLTANNIIVVGIGDLPAGNYQVRARVIRNNTGNGNVSTNGGMIGSSSNCNDVAEVTGQFIMQVFPK